MNQPELRQLDAFVALAEELHFGRAADRLGLTQPSLSRAIGGLERDLGVPLFDRTTRRVVLTAAGEAMLADARAALRAAQAAARRAIRAGAKLAVVSKPDGDGGLLPGILNALDVETELLFAATGDEAAAMVRDGRGDVALIAAPFDRSGLDTDVVFTEPRVAALPVGCTATTLQDLLAEPAVSWPHVGEDLAAYYTARDPRTLANVATPPPVTPGPAGTDLTQALRLVELGQAVTFIPTSVARRYPREGIVYREVAGLSEARLHVAWSADSRSPLVAAFVRAAPVQRKSPSRHRTR